MIQPDRLKGLIEQKATIYGITGLPCWVEEINLGSLLYEEIGNWLYKVDTICYGSGENDFRKERLDRFGSENLFETKEDAEFTLRYKRIPKTEYLDLPTWEEFNSEDKLVAFTVYPHNYHLLKVSNYICLRSFYGQGGMDIFNKPLTKENYFEVCELCRSLFLGEK